MQSPIAACKLSPQIRQTYPALSVDDAFTVGAFDAENFSSLRRVGTKKTLPRNDPAPIQTVVGLVASCCVGHQAQCSNRLRNISRRQLIEKISPVLNHFTALLEKRCAIVAIAQFLTRHVS